MAAETRERVLVLTHNFPRFANDISGIGFQPLYQSLAKHLELHFVVPHDKGLPEYEEKNGLHVHRFRYGSDDNETLAYRGDMHKRVMSAPLQARAFLKCYLEKSLEISRKFDPATIWAHWWIPGGMVARKVAARTGKPFVVTCHGTDIHLLKKMSLLKPLARRIFNEARAINVVSGFLKQNLLQSAGDKFADKVFIAPLIIDRTHIYFDPDQPRRKRGIISASRFTTQKNIDILIESIAQLKHQHVDCTLDLYGSGPEEANLRKLVQDRSLSSSVSFLAPLPQAELAQKYRESEIVCLVSEREGFGLMLVEAMMCGCAAVGARSGGITDIITEDGEDGLLVAPRDVDELTAALRSLLTDHAHLNKIAYAGRKSVETRFSPEAITQSFLTHLKKS